MSIMDKLKKNSYIKETTVLSDSKLYSAKEMIPTQIPMLNVALAGAISKGLTSGSTIIAGPSKHFKSLLALIIASAYMKKHPDAVMIFYDTEFGMPEAYFDSLGIDRDRVLHVPVMNIEELKFDIIKQLDGLDRKDNVIILIDSLGNIASKKEMEDALSEKSVADMTRAKALKSLFRMVTPYLTKKDIPLIGINHTYQEQGLFPKAVVSGGCVVAGTQITLPDGTTKAVEDFIEGDMVQTLDGAKEVTHTWNPETLEEGEPECFEIEFEDGHKVTCSAKHKFLIEGKWVEAQDLIEGMDCEVKKV